MGIITIKPEIIDWFLARDLNNFDFLKHYTEEELDKQLAEIKPKPIFHKALYKHQKVMFLIGTMQSSFIYWTSMGGGKTKVSLDLINWRKTNKSALVIVPDVQNIGNWLTEVEKFTPNLKAVPVYGSIKEKKEKIQQVGDIYIISYTGLQHILNSNTEGRSIVINPKDIQQFASRI